MSYKLYTDKANKFSCTIQVDGASLSTSKVRLVVESDGINYMFDGKIYEGGNCEVTIPKTKNFLSEESKGNMRLEVIADDVYFEPWSSNYVVETTKKVNVVVQEQVETKPRMVVTVTEQEKPVKKPIVQEVKKPIVKEVKKPTQTKMTEHLSQLSKKDVMNLLKNR
jgi:hypothetical protein